MPYESICINDTLISGEHIELCFKVAENGLNCGEVPVGCVFLARRHNQTVVLASDHNRTNASRNATRHAEMQCVDAVVDGLAADGDRRQLLETMATVTVLLTLEPCVMCLRALRALRVKQVIYGAKNERFGGSTLSSLDSRLIADPPLKTYQLLDSSRAINLLQKFYDQNNQNAPKPAIKKARIK